MSQKSKIHPLLVFLGAFCFGSVFLILGILIIGSGISALDEGRASLSWQTCEGIITHLEMERSRASTKKSGSSYAASIRYDYTVEEKKYTGDRYSVRGNLVNANDREKFVATHSVGTVVTVYYSPSSPETSLLVPGTNYANYVLLGFGILLSFFGAIIAFASVRSVVGK